MLFKTNAIDRYFNPSKKNISESRKKKKKNLLNELGYLLFMRLNEAQQTHRLLQSTAEKVCIHAPTSEITEMYLLFLAFCTMLDLLPLLSEAVPDYRN